MQMLTLEASGALLLKHRLAQSEPAAATVRVPRRVMQYWDRNPPAQISRLLERTRSLSEQAGAEYVLFDHPQARAYIETHGEPEVLEAYDVALHPAMKCDVFRLCYLYHSGGYYVDADIVVRKNVDQLLALPGALVVFQWDSQDLRNLCNWLIGAEAGEPTMAMAMQATAQSVLRACKSNPEAALKNILGVSGPGVFTRAVATDLARRMEHAQGQVDGIRVETVSRAHQLIQLGPAYLREPLGYKTDERHWRTAGEQGASGPAAAPRTAAAPARPESWLGRLVGRLRGTGG